MEKFFFMKDMFKKNFTKSLLKKIMAVFVVVAICAGSGAYYLHEKKVAAKIAAIQAQTLVIENLAKEKNIVLIDSDAIKNLTAKTIGVDTDKITYKEISLKDHDKKSKHENNSTNAFQPIYKVSCLANNVKYKLRIDAVSGAVLDIDIG